MTLGLIGVQIFQDCPAGAGRNSDVLFEVGTMEILELEPRISADGRAVNFALPVRGRDLECSITCEALEQHFWLQRGAGEARILKTFEDGRKRILAMAERKFLARPAERLMLTANDFGVRP